MDKYEYWFANLQGVSGRKKWKIRQGMKSAEELYYIEETARKVYGIQEKEYETIIDSIRTWNLEDEYQKMLEKGVQCVTMSDSCYPRRLRNIGAAPYAIYWKGQLPKEEKMTVAIVGARDCSAYGECMAREFGEVLSLADVQIVSGMANGVDSASQKGALERNGSSFGILGCGVDICYPREQITLYMKLQEQGGILSEFPIGTKPLPQHFPARNRIISGLSDVVLVMEAKEKSGSLITADMALEQGKDVYALPGPINSCLSRGCNALIKQGASVLMSPEELLDELGILKEKYQKINWNKKILLETSENLVYSCLCFQPQNIETILNATKISVGELMDVLVALELKGLIKEISKNNYVKIR